MLTIRHNPGSNCKTNVPHLDKWPQVRSIYGVASDTDLIVEVSASDAAELEGLVQQVRMLAGIDHIVTHVILKTYFEHRPSN